MAVNPQAEERLREMTDLELAIGLQFLASDLRNSLGGDIGSLAPLVIEEAARRLTSEK